MTSFGWFILLATGPLGCLGLWRLWTSKGLRPIKRAIFARGALDDADHAYIRYDENFDAHVDRAGTRWVRVDDVHKLPHHRREAENAARIPGPRPATNVEEMLHDTPVEAERDEAVITVFWTGARQTVSLVFSGGDVTAVMSPAHPDYRATKLRVAEVLALFWPCMELDDGRDGGLMPRWFFPALTAQPDDVVDRLRGRYACGPIGADGQPEFGFRQFEGMTPLHHEAADIILEQRRVIAQLEKLHEEEEEEIKQVEFEADKVSSF